MKILAGIEDSQSANVLLQAILRQFPPSKTQVRGVHVVQPFVAGVPPQMSKGYAPELASEKQAAGTVLEEFVLQLRKAGFTADTAIEFGDIRERILEDAREMHADLILVGSHGRKGVSRFVLGSVAEYVAGHADCSVEIVRSPAVH